MIYTWPENHELLATPPTSPQCRLLNTIFASFTLSSLIETVVTNFPASSRRHRWFSKTRLYSLLLVIIYLCFLYWRKQRKLVYFMKFVACEIACNWSTDLITVYMWCDYFYVHVCSMYIPMGCFIMQLLYFMFCSRVH